MIGLKLKASLVGTPVEFAAQRARWLFRGLYRHRHPEHWDIYLEDQRLPLILNRLLTPSSNVVDVGCHIGSFLSHILRICPSGRHTAIEPSPEKAAWLRSRYPRVTVHSVAVGDRSGTAIYYEKENDPGRSRIDDAIPNAKQVIVDVRTLDHLLLDEPKIDFIKLDIEGGELNALKGATETIGQYKPVVLFECGATASLNEVNVSRRDLFEFITGKLGYQVFTYSDFLHNKGPLSFDEFRKCGIYPFKAFNFVAIPP